MVLKIVKKSSTCQKYKTHNIFVQIYHYCYMSKNIPKLFTILISRDLKNQKVGLHPPPTTHHQNKKKVSALKSEILIKYKRIKWTPSCKALLLLPGGLISFKTCQKMFKTRFATNPMSFEKS